MVGIELFRFSFGGQRKDGEGEVGVPPPTIDPKICLKNGPKAVLLGEFYFCLKWGRGAVVSLPKAAITYTWMLDRYVLLEV